MRTQQTGRKRAAQGSFKRRLAGALIATLSLVAGAVATAQPAEAAAGVTACFRFPAPYNGAWSDPLQLQAYTTAGWQTISYGKGGVYNGCESWTISGTYRNYYLKVIAYKRVGTATFYGSSPLMALPGNMSVHLGTALVQCTGCSR